MKTVNKVTLLGNVTRDPEIRTTPTGRNLCMFGLATNRAWKDSTGARQTMAEYHNLVCWGKLADIANQYVQKGKPIYVEGRLKTRAWNSETGLKLFRTEIVIDDLVLLGQRDSAAMAAAAESALPLDDADPEPEGEVEQQEATISA